MRGEALKAVIAVIVVGCTSATPVVSEPAPTAAPVQEVKEPTKVEVPPVVAPILKPVVPPEVLALKEARALFGKKDYAGAWAKIQPAAAVARSDGRLQCEAGYIGFHAGQQAAAESLLRAGLGLLGRDSTGPGRKGRAMCLYNLALVQEQAGTLGEAICSLRRSEALRPNKAVKAKRTALEGKVNAAEFKCSARRTARSRDVKALAREYAEAANLKVTSASREAAGEFAVHTIHLDPGPQPDDELVVYEDVQFVVLERDGALAPLGVLGYTDQSITYFRGGGSWRFVGVKPAAGGTLALFERETWWRGDSEEVKSSYGFSSHVREELLVCRWDAGAEAGGVRCAQVPLGAREEVDEEMGSEETTGGEAVRTWGASVDYSFDEAAGALVFEGDEDERATAEKLGLPQGRVSVAEVFERWEEDDVGLAI